MIVKLHYYKNLTGVRAIAALLVMFLHFFNQLNIDTETLIFFFNFSKIGQTGVTLFFVLSGFLITRILINTKNHKNYFKNFYFRRTLRIFPLYYLFLILYYYVFPSILNTSETFTSQPYYFSYLQNFALTFQWSVNDGPGHFWSLAVEEHFYLIWPLVVFLNPQKSLKRLIYVIIISALTLRFIISFYGYEIMWLTFTRMDSLAIGGLLAFWEMDKRISKNSNLFVYGILIFSFLTFATSLLLKDEQFRDTFHSLKYTFWSFGFFCCIGYVLSINKQHFINKMLCSKFLEYTGKISYGLYVYHLFAFTLIRHHFSFNSWIIQMIVSFAFTYFISAISYHFFEVFFLKLKGYFND
jgi:peptidoglycan/LPS O-acetylase OafA/YrhL